MNWQRKPILISGLALSGGLWFWWQMQAAVAEFSELTLWLMIATGSGFWWLRRRSRSAPALSPPTTPVTRTEAEAAIAQARAHLDCLAAAAPQSDRQAFEQTLAALPAQLDRQADRVTILGGRKVGKTSLLQALQTAALANPYHWQEWATGGNPEEPATDLTPALQADLLLFVIAGDLTESDLRLLQQLQAARARLLVVFNKLDHYAPSEQVAILQQIRSRLHPWLPARDLVATAAAPAPLKVYRPQPDGTRQEHWETQPVVLGALGDRLTTLFATEGQALAWATVWRAARQVERDINQALNAVRRQQALPIVERYQWLAAAAAFANPVAVLDLLATAAIGAQMVLDLGTVYQQKLSLAQAEMIAGTLGALVAKLGLVELSTQAIASVLKTHVVSYAAGGVLQGLSAAYLTRVAGLGLIEAFQAQDPTAALQPSQLEQALQAVVAADAPAIWQGLVQAGLARLKGAAPTSPVTT